MNPMPEHAKEKFIQMLLKFETPKRVIEARKAEEEKKKSEIKQSPSD